MARFQSSQLLLRRQNGLIDGKEGATVRALGRRFLATAETSAQRQRVWLMQQAG